MSDPLPYPIRGTSNEIHTRTGSSSLGSSCPRPGEVAPIAQPRGDEHRHARPRSATQHRQIDVAEPVESGEQPRSRDDGGADPRLRQLRLDGCGQLGLVELMLISTSPYLQSRARPIRLKTLAK